MTRFGVLSIASVRTPFAPAQGNLFADVVNFINQTLFREPILTICPDFLTVLVLS